MEHIGYIYETINIINNKKYIGMHKTKKLFDKSYLGSGKILLSSVKKYGKENFKTKVLEYCYSDDQLQERETHYLKKHNVKNNPNYYNIIDTSSPILYGKENGFFGKNHSQKTKKILKDLHSNKFLSDEHKIKIKKGSIDYWNKEQNKKKQSQKNLGRTLSEEHKNKIKKSNTGKKLSEITKIKISKKLKGNKNNKWTIESRKKISEALKGRKKSKEHVNKINKNPEKIRKTAEKHRGMKRSVETCKKISEAKKGKIPSNKGLVYYHDPITYKIICCKEGNEPKGYIRGYGKRKNNKS